MLREVPTGSVTSPGDPTSTSSNETILPCLIYAQENYLTSPAESKETALFTRLDPWPSIWSVSGVDSRQQDRLDGRRERRRTSASSRLRCNWLRLPGP